MLLRYLSHSADDVAAVFQLRGKEAIPVNIMMDGNGEKTKGFKGEWCTVKDDKLYIGGMGKEWVNQHGVRLFIPCWPYRAHAAAVDTPLLCPAALHCRSRRIPFGSLSLVVTSVFLAHCSAVSHVAS